MELYPFQEEGVRRLTQMNRCILADEMGLGKTAQFIAACRKTMATRILIICPNSLIANMANEIGKWYPEAPVHLCVGKRKERVEEILAFQRGFLLLNYESLQYPPILDALCRTGWHVLVCDEAHRLKNRKATWTKAAFKVARHAQSLYLLTGTPIQNRVQELWPLLHMIDPKTYSSFWRFVQQHANAHPGRWGWEISDAPTNPDALVAEIEPFFLRRTKEEVGMEVFAREPQQIWVDMTGQQQRIYNEMLDQWVAEIEDHVVSAPIALAHITRLKQICISPSLIIPGELCDPVPSTKMEALREIVAGTDQKIIIFSEWTRALRITNANADATGEGIVWHTGEMNPVQRSRSVEQFQTDPKTKIMFATIASAGEGLNLTAANLVIFLDKHWNPAINQQAVARTDRPGQKAPVQVIELLCKDSIEEWIEEMLRNKQDIIEAVNDRVKALSKRVGS